MDQFAIAMHARTMEKAEKLLSLLKQGTEGITSEIRWERDVHSRHHEFLCVKQAGGSFAAAEKRVLFREVGKSLTRYIVEEEEEALLRALLDKEYGYTHEDDIARILGFCRHLPDYGETGSRGKTREQTARERIMSQEIEKLVKEHEGIHLDGLLAFRLVKYKEELKETVIYAVDEFLMDKQYQEFISLLKSFVYIQQAKVPTVHLMHKGGTEFDLLNEKMEPIEHSETDGGISVETLEKEMSFEDLIVSTLITVAPGRIFIHTRNPELQIIKTILQIFDERAKICE